MFFDAHSDIWLHIGTLRHKGETDCFRRYHYDNFMAGDIRYAVFNIYLDEKLGYTFPELHDIVVSGYMEELKQASDILNPVLTYADFEKGINASKINVVTGMEGMNQIVCDVDLLDRYYEESYVRHGMLTWNQVNELATPWKGDADRGLTAHGRSAILKMEQLGILVDVSHLNDKNFYDIAGMATKPFIASHSNARAICNVGRNLTDAMIKEVARSGGCIGLNSYVEFVSKSPEEHTLNKLIAHLSHMLDLVGVNHVGFGFDFMHYLRSVDGDDLGVLDCGCERDMPKVLKALQTLGLTDDEVELITYKNFLRVFKETLR